MLTVALLVAAAAAYARAAVRARHRTDRALSRGAIAAFVAGWVTLAVALVSPLDRLAESLLAGHMVQHMLLILVASPLLVIGAPPSLWIWAFPSGGRRAIARWWVGSARMRRSVSWVTNPPLVLVGHAAALWFWHFPRPYQAALLDPAIHLFEHASFLGTAPLFWWVVLHPSGRRTLGYGASILYVGVTLCQTGVLGALLMYSTRAWYPMHAAGALRWGFTPLEDQQLAGLIMWIPGGAVYVGAAALLFVQWMRADERATRIAERRQIAAIAGDAA